MGWALIVLAIALPCRRLWPIGDEFYVDWYNHEWIVGYYGTYFRAHHVMPLALNTTTALGIVIPVFYGTLLYPLLGIFSTVLAPGVVLRLGAVFMFSLQFAIVNRALQRMKVPRYLALSVACLVIWAIYPLTNLYNRTAIAEFFATGLLVCALGGLVLLFHASSARERLLYASGSMLALAVSAGSHPITAMYAGPFFLVLAPLFWWLLRGEPDRRRAIVRSILPWAALSLLCVLPWVLVARQYSDHLAVRALSPDVNVIAGWDDFWNRFYPLPRDPRVIPGAPLNMAGTPYLDAQVSLSLLLMFLSIGALAIAVLREHRRLVSLTVALALALFVIFSWLSVSRDGYQLLPKIFVMIQYVYRAVTYQNLATLLGIFLVIMTLRATRGDAATEILDSRVLKAITVAALALAAIGVVIKWDHVAATTTHTGKRRAFETTSLQSSYVRLPAQYYALTAYTTDLWEAQSVPPSALGKVWTEKLKVGVGDSFGRPLPLELEYPEARWVMTNVQAFPWNKVFVDGREVDTRVHFDQLTVEVPAGKHVITAELVPSPVWRVLHTVAVVATFAWCLFVLGLAIRNRRVSPG